MRCPVLLLTGFSCGNSDSQKRSTYAGRWQSVATSPIRKYSLSGMRISPAVCFVELFFLGAIGIGGGEPRRSPIVPQVARSGEIWWWGGGGVGRWGGEREEGETGVWGRFGGRLIHSALLNGRSRSASDGGAENRAGIPGEHAAPPSSEGSIADSFIAHCSLQIKLLIPSLEQTDKPLERCFLERPV